MSVNTWEREVSNVAFLWQTHKLNYNISKVISRLPQKYRHSYSDYVVKCGFEAFECLYMGNSIFVNESTPDADFKERKQLFRKGIAKLYLLGSAMNVFLDHVERADGINKNKTDKVRENVGMSIADIKSLVLNVIQSDSRRQAEYKMRRKMKSKETDSK